MWLPEHKVVFSGDIVYTVRVLGVGSWSAHRGWIVPFESMAALQPEIVVGGYGRPTDLARATADTYDYLVLLRGAVQAFMDEGHGMEEIDQLHFSQSVERFQRSARLAAGVVINASITTQESFQSLWLVMRFLAARNR